MRKKAIYANKFPITDLQDDNMSNVKLKLVLLPNAAKNYEVS